MKRFSITVAVLVLVGVLDTAALAYVHGSMSIAIAAIGFLTVGLWIAADVTRRREIDARDLPPPCVRADGPYRTPAPPTLDKFTAELQRARDELLDDSRIFDHVDRMALSNLLAEAERRLRTMHEAIEHMTASVRKTLDDISRGTGTRGSP
jgi:hypothetical protein